MSVDICFLEESAKLMFPRIKDNVEFFDRNVQLQYNMAVKQILRECAKVEYSSVRSVRKDGEILDKKMLDAETKTLLNILHFPFNYVNATDLSAESWWYVLRMPNARVYVDKRKTSSVLLSNPLSIKHTDEDWCDIITMGREFTKTGDFLSWISLPDVRESICK